jgi:hypothetical protein
VGLNLARAVCLIGRWRSRSLFVADPLTPQSAVAEVTERS